MPQHRPRVRALLPLLPFLKSRASATGGLESRANNLRKTSAAVATSSCDGASSSGSSPCVDLYGFGTALFLSVTSHEGPRGNVVVSPLSAAQSLALVAAGATPNSRCRSQLLSALGGIESHEEIPALTDAILGSANGGDDDSIGGVELITATSVWSRDIKQSYVDTATDVHSAAAKELPETYRPVNEWVEDATNAMITDGDDVHSAAAKELPETYRPVNEWVEDATNTMITDLFDGDEAIDSDVRALLVNAVFFKGMWTQKFDADLTVEGTFHVPGEMSGKGGVEELEERRARFMKARRHMLVTDRAEHLGGASVLRLDYGEAKEELGGVPEPRDFCALLVLPAAPTAESMAEAVDGLQNAPLSETLGGLFSREVDLSLPRFRVEWGASSLKKALRSMGVGDAFHHDNDLFLDMSTDRTLYLEDVLHKAVLEVTEEGTVAAAATASVMMARSMPPPPLELSFDRPFLMAVLHVPTGTPLFLVRMVEPEAVSDASQ
eukprot:CAMPEP_0197464560 /NCGR_PEP_ID=MMETSP1175-20131217/64082_1 /TAXON_ID=1003142 /ORGANISM="Triceratium dubium, Strain CCMP147" /LENGTH=494 /DNA_ID=CAMNT_0043000541 /DNA_START=142 /DNA_END=1627 /DNA_ORIENTATION=-